MSNYLFAKQSYLKIKKKKKIQLKFCLLVTRNMQLKKIKRAEKKGTESVMDEKFSLQFQSSFAVGHGDVVFSVRTFFFFSSLLKKKLKKKLIFFKGMGSITTCCCYCSW